MSREQEIAHLRTTLSLDTGDFKKELTSVSKQTTGLKKSFDIANKSIENAEDTIQATTNAIGKGEKALESMNKKLEMQKKRYDDLKSTLDKQTKAYEELSSELNKAEKELEELESAENKNVQAIENQKKAIDDLKKKLQDKAQLIDKNINNLQRYSNDIDKTENDITGLSSQLNNLRGSLQGVADATESAFVDNSSSNLDKFKDLAKEAGVNLDFLELSAKGAALALAVVITKSVIDAAGTYDKAITDLQITMGITEDSAKDLYSAIRDIADGGYSIEGITEAVTMLEQRFGLSAQQSEELAQGIDLLNKYGYESKDVVRFMTTAVNDWGMTYEGALDYILKGQQEGLNMSDDWMDTLVEYSPIFSTLGVTGNDAFLLIREAMNATGVDSDKAADMIKELMLTLTDGSDASAQALSELGLDINTLKKQIDDGSITSVEAMQKIMKAIVGMGEETEKSRLLQETFKGTIEYGSIGIVEAWNNIGDEVVNTTGTIDAAKEAFEGSYEAAKQDLSNSWNDLTETIGSKCVPALIWVVDILNTIAVTVLNIGPLLSNTLALMGNDVAQWSLGAVGKFQEFQIACIEGAIKIAEALGKDEWASKWETNLKSVKEKHSETVDKIVENEKKRAKIESEDQALRDEIYGRDKKNHTDAANTIAQNNEKIKKSSGETNKKLETDTSNSANKVSQNANKIGNDMTSGLNKAKSSAESAMSGVKGAVDNNMNGSLKTVQVQATEMYKGVKTSFFKMSQSAREDGTEMYLGVQTSARKMASSAKDAATDMYLGVTTSTSRMAQKAIADWNNIKNTYSKSISGNVTIHKKTISSQETQQAQALSALSTPTDISKLDIMPIDSARFVTQGQYYSVPTNTQGLYNINNTNNNSETNMLLKQLLNIVSKTNKNTLQKIETHLNLEGIEIARVITPYTDKINGERMNLSERGLLLL